MCDNEVYSYGFDMPVSKTINSPTGASLQRFDILLDILTNRKEL